MLQLSRARSERKGNRLSHWMLKRGVSVDDLVKRCIDANATAIDLMEKDKCMPTRGDLQCISDALQCVPTDIWPRGRLDLLGLLKDEKAVEKDHPGEVRFRVWMLQEEKDKLERAIKELGYRTPTDWFRDMAAMTLTKAGE